MSKVLKFIDLAIEYLFYFLIFSVPLIFTTSNYELFEFPKIVLTYGLTIVILTLWLIKGVIEGKFSFLKSKLFYALILYLASQIISTVFSIDIHTSIFGYYSRFNGGLLSNISYIVLFIIMLSTFDQKKVYRFIQFIIATAAIVALWGIPSHFGYDPSCRLIVGQWTSSCWSANFNPTLRIFATLGQPNWLAAYLAMILPLSITSIFVYQKAPVKIYYLASSILLFWAFILTNSRAATLGLVVGLILLIVAVLYVLLQEKTLHKFIKSNLIYLLLLTIGYILIAYLWGQTLIGRVQEAKYSIVPETSTSDQLPADKPPSLGGTESGKIRFIVWKGAVEIFKHYPIFGSGVETFAYSYYNFRPVEANQTSEWDFLYNKAHNEYLNYLATTGIVGFVSYLIVIISYLIISIRLVIIKNQSPDTNNQLLIVGLLSGYIAYLIQNFFGFSVVAISTLFFLYPAITTIISKPQFDNKDYLILNLPSKIFSQITVKIALAFLVLPVSLYLLFATYRYYLSDHLFTQAQSYDSLGDYEQAIVTYQKAINVSPATEPLYYANFALVAAEYAVSHKEDYQQLIGFSQESIEIATARSPYNLNILRLATQTYLNLTQLDDNYLENALESAKKAAELAPTEPEIQYQLGIVYNMAGQNQKAQESFEKSLNLKPDFTKAKEILD